MTKPLSDSFPSQKFAKKAVRYLAMEGYTHELVSLMGGTKEVVKLVEQASAVFVQKYPILRSEKDVTALSGNSTVDATLLIAAVGGADRAAEAIAANNKKKSPSP